jgi:putative membrane protein
MPRADRRLHPLIAWIVGALALLTGDALLSGVRIDGPLYAFIAAAFVGLVNIFVRPILFIITLPVTLVTFGLFALVLNGAMLGLAAWLAPGFSITNLMSAIALWIILALAQLFAFMVFAERR